jgi:cell division protein FtsB
VSEETANELIEILTKSRENLRKENMKLEKFIKDYESKS